MFEKLLPYDTAHLILRSYQQYYYNYKRVTKRAQIRFEYRDWRGMQADARERLTLYRDQVGKTTKEVVKLLGSLSSDDDTWKKIKQYYLEEVSNFATRNIAETFYNSIFRHSHRGLSVDKDLMFVLATATYREFRSTIPIHQTFFLIEPLEHIFRQVFHFFTFDAQWEDMERDIQYICDTLRESLTPGELPRHARIELLKSVFYRNKGAYIVGRLHLEDRITPFIIPLLHKENGIFADALLLEYNDVSSIFSYNRSYFLVDVDIVSETVDFLKSILPTKSLGELYNSIGFEKHGKTVLYRDYLRHMERTLDKFDHAPGIKGMVMAVFTTPSYNMVFKVIKDRFAAPKQVTEDEVKRKYEMVFFHDRVGRMADSHIFEQFLFERSRFSDELLQYLMEEAPSKVKIKGDIVEIKHLYIEKKMIPLNLFLDQATTEEAEEVINDYGKAIKQLAAVNIFPGDMLLKNFGVTRLKRVVFYDYDEIGPLTDYNFRRIPEAETYEEELSSEPFYSVGPNDIFPEEFRRFLIGRRDIRDIFYRLHGDLYDVGFWIDTQKKLEAGYLFDVFPYRQRLRFAKRYTK
jgi:isocitrate dehydrogenase kinase/phosphatase